MKTASQARDRIAALTVDDALAAARVLDEAGAGHEEAADKMAAEAGLGDLDMVDLEALCARFGVPWDYCDIKR